MTRSIIVLVLLYLVLCVVLFAQTTEAGPASTNWIYSTPLWLTSAMMAIILYFLKDAMKTLKDHSKYLSKLDRRLVRMETHFGIMNKEEDGY